MVSKITAGDTLDGNYGVIALESEEVEEGKSNFIVDWFGAYMMSRVPSGRKG